MSFHIKKNPCLSQKGNCAYSIKKLEIFGADANHEASIPWGKQQNNLRNSMLCYILYIVNPHKRRRIEASDLKTEENHKERIICST